MDIKVSQIIDDLEMQGSIINARTTASSTLGWLAKARMFVQSPAFEVISGILLVLNVFALSVLAELEGIDSAYEIGRSGTTSLESQGALVAVFDMVEFVCGCFFALEFALKLMALGPRFFRDVWHILEFFIVALWFMDLMLHSSAESINPNLFRVARFVRLFRLLRMLKWVRFLDPLQLIIKSLMKSMHILSWVVLVLVLMLTSFALLGNQLLIGFIRDNSVDVLERTLVFNSWGNFSRAFVTIFEMTLGNFGPPTWLLMDNVNTALFFLCVLYKLSFGFAVVQVVCSIFIQQTFKVSSWDDEMMVKEKEAQALAFRKNLYKLFDAIDESGDGRLQKEEFEAIVDNSTICAWLSALEVDATHIAGLFDLLEDGEGFISRYTFNDFINMLKGEAKASHMFELQLENRKMSRQITDLVKKIEELTRASRHEQMVYADAVVI